MNLPAQAIEVRKEIQRLLGFVGDQVDGDFGKMTAAGFNQLGDMPDMAMWPRSIASAIIDVGREPSGGADASNALHPALGSAERERTFGGPFRWVRKPTAGNKENIEILGDWEAKNIVSVELPELALATNGKFTRMRWNVRAVKQLRGLWQAWHEAGLLKHVVSYEGAFVPRLIRGSTTSLSNHAYGTAFDINYEGNELGATPAAIGTRNSVRELVPLAHKFGFYWGGNFSRRDGMHFEICKILT